MKKAMWIGILACLLAATGCGTVQRTEEPQPSTVSNEVPKHYGDDTFQPLDWEKAEISQVTVSRSQSIGEVYPAALGSFVNAEDLALFREAFRSAEKKTGMLDIGIPEYDLSFADEEGQRGFHLWLGDRPGSPGLYTYVNATGTGYTLSAEHADRLREKIRSLAYTREQAIANGDIVVELGRKSNLDRWKQFVESVREGGASGEAHITDYTIEGQPIFRDLIYDGQAIRYTYDNRMDSFGTPTRVTTYCKALDQEGTEFSLSKCDSEGLEFRFSTAETEE
jgi:hypothetical protein